MKKSILIICIAALGVSCTPEPKDYVTLSGTISNHNAEDSLVIRQGKDFTKVIAINEDGTFSDTLKIPEEGIYYFIHNKENSAIYLANGNETSFTIDTKEFDESLKFEGGNADKSNFLIQNYLLNETELGEAAGESVEVFNTHFDTYKEKYEALKLKYDLDSAFINKEDQNLVETKKFYLEYIQNKAKLNAEFTGKPSASFDNYENFKGGTSSLSDFKGKYVYIDVWATWCGPCKAEIPHLKTIEEKYHGKNIEFLSISVDALDKKEDWKNMVKEKELGGVQLFADNSWQSKFVTDYKISGIPRFILIDPNGNVVSPDAPRPSSPKLVELLTSEGL